MRMKLRIVPSDHLSSVRCVINNKYYSMSQPSLCLLAVTTFVESKELLEMLRRIHICKSLLMRNTQHLQINCIR